MPLSLQEAPDMRQRTKTAVDYSDPTVIEEAFQWRLKEQEDKGDPAGPVLQKLIRKDLENPENVRSVLQGKANSLRREREEEVGSQEALERRAARSEDQRRRRILLNAHPANECECLREHGPSGHCPSMPRLKVPNPEVLKNPTPEWGETYHKHLATRKPVSIFEWVQAVGGGLARKVSDAEELRGDGWCEHQVEIIERDLRERFAGRFKLYGEAYWNQTAFRNIARERFEQVVDKALREKEEY